MARTPPPLLTPDELEEALRRLPSWSARKDRLVLDRRFGSFDAAFGFMARVALHAERLDHHPDWHNVWDRVSIELWTHEAGGLTSRDVALAEVVEDILASLPGARR
jgi:4a-hydroxytetrahydrobiopterin dehydratase